MAKAPIPVGQLPVIDRNSHPDASTDFAAGTLILMDKPKGWSSFKGVKWVKKNADFKKVGHAGTLDPMATGLLILCTGKATKSILQIQEMDKTYDAEITFGASTPSYDAETEPDVTADWEHISREAILEKISSDFTGLITQQAPAYSALKHKGKPLYKYAREGVETVKKIRDVSVYEFELLRVEMPVITARITCSKGTYIRSIAHDIGLALNSRAHLSGLRRTKTGTFTVENAVTPDDFAQALNPES